MCTIYYYCHHSSPKEGNLQSAFYFGKKLEVKKFVSCIPLQQQKLPVISLLIWPLSSAAQCCLMLPQLAPKTSCTPPSTAFVVPLWRRSGCGVSEGLESYCHPLRTLAWLWGEGMGSRGWVLRALARGDATLGRVAEPSPLLPMHNPADRYRAAAAPCSLFWGKRKRVAAGEREKEAIVFFLPSRLPFPLFRGTVTIVLLWRHH